MEVKNFDRKGLSDYILEVMDGSSVNAFAKKCSISRGVLSGIINQSGTLPNVRTLKQIATGSGADINRLMTICGYPVSDCEARQHMPLCERIQKNMEDISIGLSILTEGTKLYKSLEDLLNNWTRAYKHDCVSAYVQKDKTCYSEIFPDAERCAFICFRLMTAESVCHTYAVVYYVETKGGKIVALGSAFDEASFFDVGFIPVQYKSPGMETFVYKQNCT